MFARALTLVCTSFGHCQSRLGDAVAEVEGEGEELVHAEQDAKEEAVADAINKANGFE